MRHSFSSFDWMFRRGNRRRLDRRGPPRRAGSAAAGETVRHPPHGGWTPRSPGHVQRRHHHAGRSARGVRQPADADRRGSQSHGTVRGPAQREGSRAERGRSHRPSGGRRQDTDEVLSRRAVPRRRRHGRRLQPDLDQFRRSGAHRGRPDAHLDHRRSRRRPCTGDEARSAQAQRVVPGATGEP